MAESQVLAKLHDIHLPEPIGWWPVAPGWYVLAGLILFIVGLSTYYLRLRYRNGLAKRQALVLLEHYKQEYLQEKNSQESSMKISGLLRRVALAYYPRQEVAGLQGEAWLAFLNETAKDVDFSSLRESVLDLPYQAAQDKDLAPFFACAKAWIKQRRAPCSN